MLYDIGCCFSSLDRLALALADAILAAVNDDCLPSNERRIVACQKQNRPGSVLRFLHPLNSLRLGFAIRVPKSNDPSRKVLAAIEHLLHDDAAKERAASSATTFVEWDGPKLAAQQLLAHYGKEEEPYTYSP